jgi:predicted RNA-binding protein
MCQTVAYMVKEGNAITLLQDVVAVTPIGGSLKLTNLFGDELVVAGKICRIDLLSHRILIEPSVQL